VFGYFGFSVFKWFQAAGGVVSINTTGISFKPALCLHGPHSN
jgi:hypothetical protein